jgi:DNA-binding NtrC family response regulator
MRPARAAGATVLAQAAGTVLYVPAPRARSGIDDRLSALRRPVVVASDIPIALQRLADGQVDVCVIDLGDERSAIPLIRLIRSQHPAVPVIAVADAAHPTTAAEALYSGVSDLLAWPFGERELLAAMANAADRTGVRAGLGGDAPGSRIFSHAPAMRRAVEQLQSAAARRGPVGVSGETGTGRRLLARALHDASANGTDGAARPFVVVDCAGSGPQELEHALFGGVAERGTSPAEASAVERLGRSSAVAAALGGTLVLRGLPEAPARVQARLARLLRDGEAALGGQRDVVDLDLRPVAIFGAEVDLETGDGRLRRDLADRFSASRIEVPPLRRRREDIPVLAVHLLDELVRAGGREARTLSRSAMALLAALPWQGNVPELRGLLETLVRGARRPVIQLDDILEHAQLDGLGAVIDPGVTLREAKARFERDCISTVLIRHHGRVGEAAKALGIQRTNLYRKVRQLNVTRALLSARK